MIATWILDNGSLGGLCIVDNMLALYNDRGMMLWLAQYSRKSDAERGATRLLAKVAKSNKQWSKETAIDLFPSKVLGIPINYSHSNICGLSIYMADFDKEWDT